MCDKLHNARSLIMDLRGKRADLWSRFSAGRDETCWYYRQLIAAFKDALKGDPSTSLRMGELLEELETTVDILERESAQ
jgi:GTP pyrophosphokinase